MATANDGLTSYQTAGAGGKFRKRPVRRSSQATPYDRPPTAIRNNNNNPSLFSKLVDPASRLIYAGADRLFGVFRKRLPSAPAPRLPGISEEPRNRPHEAVPNSDSKNSTGVVEPSTNEGGNLARISVATEISDLENMLKQKTFTRSEIERLTALLLSRTKESNVVEGDKEKLPSTSYHVQNIDAFTSDSLNKHVEEREIGNLDAAFSTPVVNSRVFEDDGASPAELAKAYMGTRSTKVSPLTIRPSSQALRQDSLLLNNTTTFPKTPTTSLVPRTATAIKTSETSLTTLRSRGRSALYNMPRTPYYRGPSTLSQKGVASPSAWEHEGSIGSSRMAGKRRSSALDDIGSGGPMRRIRQKANLLSQQSSLSKQKNELGSSQKLLLRNEPEPKGSKAVEGAGEISKRNQSYGSVPTESSQMALKIFEQLDRMSPKEKLSGSKLAGTAGKTDSPKKLSNSQDIMISEGQHRVLFSDAREPTFQSKGTGAENGSRNIAGHGNVLSSVNGSFTGPLSGNVSNVTKAGSATKRAFSMSAHEDSLELDDDNRSNGHASISLGENKKPGTSLLANDDVFTGAHAETLKATGAMFDSRKGAISTALSEVDPIPGVPEAKQGAIFSGGSVFSNQKISNFPASTSLSSNTQSSVPSQSTSIIDTITAQNKQTAFPTFGLITSNGVGSFGVKPNYSPDAKPPGSTSLINSTMNNDQVKLSDSNKDDNGSTQKPGKLFGNSGTSSSANVTATSTSGVFSFGGSINNSGVINGTSVSSPLVFASSSSFQSSGPNTNKIISSSSSPVLSSATTASLPSTTTAPAITSAASSSFSSSVPAPVFSFGSATASSTSALLAPAAPSATSSNGGSIFGLSSSSATLTTNGFQANTQAASTAVTQTAPPFKFGSGTSGTPSSTSAGSIFSSSAPSFGLTPAGGSISSSTTSIFGSGSSSTPSLGLTSAVTSPEIKFGGSTSSSTSKIFGSGASSTPSFGISSTVASSETKSGSSASNIFGSTPVSFGASSASVPSSTNSPFMFGSSNTGASTGSSTSMPSATTSPFMFGSSNASASTGSSTIMSSATSSLFMFGSSNASASTGSSTIMSSATNSPSMFGSSNAGASTGSSLFSFTSNSPSPAPAFGNSTPVFGSSPTNNNDHMSMEDSMADDSNQAPSPSVPSFAQAPSGTPGFMFGSATPSTPSVVPFQFGGQTNQPQPPSQNPFAASGGSPFNAGGSFSLGSGGDDKSNRRIVRVKRQNRRK